MLFDIKNRLRQQGRSQSSLIPILHERGIRVDTSSLSDALNGRRNSASYIEILENCNDIVMQMERIAAKIV